MPTLENIAGTPVLSRETFDPTRPYLYFAEEERGADGAIDRGLAIFLTGHECPWRCLMCDLWRHTLLGPTPSGAIPAQIDFAFEKFQQSGVDPASARQIKLYNSGSFFDPQAIPPEDIPAIATRARGFKRVIVECHPALVGESALRFRDLLPDSTLEVAMGLETVHPQILPRLNKRMTLDQFASSAAFLKTHGIALRVFILVKPPFQQESEAVEWAVRSLDFAFDCGATVAVLIPVRGGNEAMEALAAQGQFSPPSLATLETALERGIALNRGRVFADEWDLERLASCKKCFPARAARLKRMNLTQELLPAIQCDSGSQ